MSWPMNQDQDQSDWANGGDFVLFDTPGPIPTIKTEGRPLPSNYDWGSGAPSPAPLFIDMGTRRTSVDSGESCSVIETPAQSPMMGRADFDDYRRGAGSYEQHLSPTPNWRDGALFSGESGLYDAYQISPFMGHDDSELTFPTLDLKPGMKLFPDLEPAAPTRPSLPIEYSNMSLDGMLPGASKGSPVLEPAVPVGPRQMTMSMASYNIITTDILMKLIQMKELQNLQPVFQGIAEKLRTGHHATLRDVEKEIMGFGPVSSSCPWIYTMLISTGYLLRSRIPVGLSLLFQTLQRCLADDRRRGSSRSL